MIKQKDFSVLMPLKIKTRGEKWYKKLIAFLFESRKFILLEDFIYTTDSGIVIVIPEDFIFDGVSIPKFLRWFLSPVGLLLIPAIIHDFIYANGFYYYKFDDITLIKRLMTRKEADSLFYKISYEVNEMHLVDIPAYIFVRCFGWLFWSKVKKTETIWQEQ